MFLKRLNISNKMLFHPKANWLSRLIFQLKIFKYEFIEKRTIIYIDERGFAIDAPRNNTLKAIKNRIYSSIFTFI